MRAHIAYIGFVAAVGILLLLNGLGIFRSVYGLDTAILLTLICGYKIIYNAISDLLNRKLSADLAIVMAAGTALYVGEYTAAAEAMFIMLIGEGLEAYAAQRTHGSLEKLVKLVPRTARVYRDGREQEINIEHLVENDLVLVRAGERIPVDGVVVDGHSSVDQSTITGESIPAEKHPADEVFTGTMNGAGALRVKVTRIGKETTLAKVIQLMRDAQKKKAPIERTVDRYAKYFLPTILLVAGATYFFTGEWLRVVSVLIVACPCALVLATPVAVVAAIGRLAREGILVKGGDYVERMAQVDCIVFDKTGTLTEGNPSVVSVIPYDARSAEEILLLAARAEQASEHLLGQLLVKEAERRGLPLAQYEPDISAFVMHPGMGVETQYNGNRILVGSRLLMSSRGVSVDQNVDDTLAHLDAAGQTAVLVSENGSVAGAIGISDPVRAATTSTIAQLKELGIRKIYMLTGDRERVARAIARQVGIDEVVWQLLPEQKVNQVRNLQERGLAVAMVGDGINDAPCLAAADVGIAMGGTGSDITAQAADVVLMTDNLDKLPFLITFCRRTIRTIKQNILWFAFVANVVAAGAAARGLIGPVASAIVHQGSSLLVILNSLRLYAGRLRETKIANRIAQTARLAELKLEAIKAADFDKLGEWAKARKKAITVRLTALLCAAYILSGIYLVPPDEIAVVQRFGRKLEAWSYPGLHYSLPWPVDRVWKIKANKVRAIELGFRTTTTSQGEPAAYEWNIQHRSGRYEKRPEEALTLAGDENLIEANLVVQYVVNAPDRFLFRSEDPEKIVRAISEHAFRYLAGSADLDALLTTGRATMESKAHKEIQEKLNRYECGVQITEVKLQDVHPSLEVVDAFRDVASALEEKNKLINEAEAYYKEQVLLARGQAQAKLQAAEGYRLDRINRALGDSQRFVQAESAYQSVPAVTETRLYLETIEQVLPGKSKFIVDSHKVGKRQIFFMDSQGLRIAPKAIDEKKK